MLLAGLTLTGAPQVAANTAQPRMHLGRIWHAPEFDGAEGWDGSSLHYPASLVKNPGEAAWTSGNALKRGWIAHSHKWGTYLSTTSWTNPDAVVDDFSGSYLFRSYNYDAYAVPDWIIGSLGSAGTENYAYPGNVEVSYRWAQPRIIVGGTELTLRNPVGDSGAPNFIRSDSGEEVYPADVIDPDLVTEQTIYMWWRYLQGVEYQRTQYGYPMGSAHQDYIINDIKLTNNGISGTSAAAPVLTGQTLTNVVWTQAYDFKNKNAKSGTFQHNDNLAWYIEPWGAGGNVALYWHDGNAKDLVPAAADLFAGDDWGDPTDDAFYDGNLLGLPYVMFGTLFVSQDPANYDTPLAGQPARHVITGERGMDLAAKAYSPADAEGQFDYMTSGDYQLALDTEMRDDVFAAQWADPTTSDGATSGTALMGYGPAPDGVDYDHRMTQGWTLGFNDAVRIVQVLAAGGLDKDAAQVIGKAWNERLAASAAALFTAEEIALIQSGEDSVQKAVQLAYWNFNGSFASVVTPADMTAWGISNYVASKPAGHDAEFDVPDAPRPPAAIAIRARANDANEGGGIEVRWSEEAEADPDHDTGVLDFSHYNIYRQEGSRLAPMELIASSSAGNLASVAADANIDFAGRTYWDRNVTEGVDYWYTVTAVDDGTQNWAQPGTPLESSRWWTWTGYSEFGITAPSVGTAVNGSPDKFALSQNAPNPFNPSTTINFSLAQAGDASLVIYGPTGQVVRTLVNGTLTAGQHSAVWDGMDNSGRPVASGVYIYRLVSGDNVANARMVLVR
jgi:hypothetical protein